MATTHGTTARRGGHIVAAAFVSGLSFALAVTGPAAWEPPPESIFQIDEASDGASDSTSNDAVRVAIEDVPVEAERPPTAVEENLPAAAVLLASKPTPTLPTPTPPPPTPPPPTPLPERLALADAPAPIGTAIIAQALPTSVRDDVRVEQPATPQPLAPAGPLLPTPVVPHEVGDEAVVPAESSSLRALVTRLQAEQLPAPAADASLPIERPRESPAAAPLPGEAWTDPDGVNWSESPAPGQPAEPTSRGGRLLGRIADRRAEFRGDSGSGADASAAPPGAGRLLDRVRDRIAQRPSHDRPAAGGAAAMPTNDGTQWPTPEALIGQLRQLAVSGDTSPAATWAADTLGSLATATDTSGPGDTAGEAPLIVLGDRVPEGMKIADDTPDAPLASQIRRAALALARRVAVWRAAASCCAEYGAAPAAVAGVEVGPGLAAACTTIEVARLLDGLERYEVSRDPADAARVRESLRAVVATTLPAARALDRAVHDHYLSPNVRIAINDAFVEKMLPESTVTTGPLQDYVLGRKVRGTKTVEQSTAIRFTPHPTEIRLELLVMGEVASRTVTNAGSVAIHSRGLSTFTVFKPLEVSPRGLSFGAARGSASNQSQLAGIETGFDSVPLMGSIVRGFVRNQHDENLDQATREVNVKIVSRACHEVDQQTEPQFTKLAEQIRERFWAPMERLGLEPTAVALETSSSGATARLRLAAAMQLAAHTPRPRAPEDSLFSMQVHESSVNNACGRFGLAGRKLSLEELTRLVCSQLGLPPQVPDDLPEGVDVTFAAAEPVRIECRDGLVQVRVSLDALESGRRNNWYDIVAQVAYRPVADGLQVRLEREGPVQLSGPGHKGRMEFGLRTIFGKMFPKERPVKLVPMKMLANPRLAGVQAVQAVSADGWLAIALAATTQAGGGRTSATAIRPPEATQRLLRR
jgi:hypothetical protein